MQASLEFISIFFLLSDMTGNIMSCYGTLQQIRQEICLYLIPAPLQHYFLIFCWILILISLPFKLNWVCCEKLPNLDFRILEKHIASLSFHKSWLKEKEVSYEKILYYGFEIDTYRFLLYSRTKHEFIAILFKVRNPAHILELQLSRIAS